MKLVFRDDWKYCGILLCKCSQQVFDMRIVTIVIVLLVVTGCDEDSGPDVAPELLNKVVSGRLEGVSEKTAGWVWGDGVNELCQAFSRPGWFYGSQNSGASSADVAILLEPDPLSLIDAESLTYNQEFVFARPGHTVVFRGRNGFFGAWSIEDIDDDGLLYGTWYFRSGGGGDFTAEVVEGGPPARVASRDCRYVY